MQCNVNKIMDLLIKMDVRLWYQEIIVKLGHKAKTIIPYILANTWGEGSGVIVAAII